MDCHRARSARYLSLGKLSPQHNHIPTTSESAVGLPSPRLGSAVETRKWMKWLNFTCEWWYIHSVFFHCVAPSFLEKDTRTRREGWLSGGFSVFQWISFSAWRYVNARLKFVTYRAVDAIRRRWRVVEALGQGGHSVFFRNDRSRFLERAGWGWKVVL